MIETGTILALDTSMEASSVAIYDCARQEILAESYQVPGRGHAEILFDQIFDVVNECSVGLKSISRFAVSTGPGNFTGVRIALAAARGLAMAAGKSVVGRSSLEVIAAGQNARSDTMVAVAADARRGEVYLAIYSGHGAIVAPILLPIAGAADLIVAQAQRGDLVLAGTGAELVCAAAHRTGALLRTAGGSPYPRASNLCRLAAHDPGASGAPSPIYLRAPDARLPAGEPV